MSTCNVSGDILLVFVLRSHSDISTTVLIAVVHDRVILIKFKLKSILQLVAISRKAQKAASYVRRERAGF